MKFSLAPTLVFAAAIAACSTTTDPFRIGDVYVLQSIAGKSLPAEYAANPDYHARMLADTLVLASDGTAEWRAWIESDQAGGAPRSERSPMTYTVSGNRISVSFLCQDTVLASCIAPPHLVGTIDDAGIAFDESRVTRQPLVFRRAVLPE
jgi:hypothetical protein